MKVLLLAAAISVVSLTAHAMPMVKAFTVESDTPSITQVWGGCGPGFMPTRWGCRPDPRWRGPRRRCGMTRWGWRCW